MKTEFYVRFKPSVRNGRVVGIKPEAVTRAKPQPRNIAVIVKFAVDFDLAMFDVPEVKAAIGAGDAEVIAEVMPPQEADRE